MHQSEATWIRFDGAYPMAVKVAAGKIDALSFVHVLNSVQYFHVTGSAPPHRPPTAAQYAAAGLPWFEYYATDGRALRGSRKLAALDSVAEKSRRKGVRPETDEPAFPKVVKKQSSARPNRMDARPREKRAPGAGSGRRPRGGENRRAGAGAESLMSFLSG